MRKRSSFVLGLAVALVLSASPATAGQDDRSVDLTSPPGPVSLQREAPRSPAEQARSALQEVKRAFAGTAEVTEAEGGRSLTLLLRDLLERYDDLSPAEQEVAQRYFARPTDPASPEEDVTYGAGANPTSDCAEGAGVGSEVCVHYATATGDAPDPTDADVNGVPDWVDDVRFELNKVWTHIVSDGGYLAPLSDLTSTNHGPDARLDVYLADIGDRGYYGYCTSDDPDWQSTNRISAYCVLDDDYDLAQFPYNTPQGNMQVTAAHEFFHAVQFAYDYLEDAWLMEGTASWVEDEVYDNVNDNRSYLADSPLGYPWIPLDYWANDYLGQYGSWIFWRYLSERYPDTEGSGMPVVIRDIWDRAYSPTFADWGDYSLQAVKKELAARGVTFTKFFQKFGVANRRPAKFYEEGKKYTPAPLADKFTIKGTKPWVIAGKPAHLSNSTFRVKPGSALSTKRWKLRVSADLPKRSFGYGTAVTIYFKNGTVSTKYIGLNAAGDGKVAVPFNTRKTKFVEVTLTNASTRFDCWQGTGLSCMGISRDDARRVEVVLKAFR